MAVLAPAAMPPAACAPHVLGAVPPSPLQPALRPPPAPGTDPYEAISHALGCLAVQVGDLLLRAQTNLINDWNELRSREMQLQKDVRDMQSLQDQLPARLSRRHKRRGQAAAEGAQEGAPRSPGERPLQAAGQRPAPARRSAERAPLPPGRAAAPEAAARAPGAEEATTPSTVSSTPSGAPGALQSPPGLTIAPQHRKQSEAAAGGGSPSFEDAKARTPATAAALLTLLEFAVQDEDEGKDEDECAPGRGDECAEGGQSVHSSSIAEASHASEAMAVGAAIVTEVCQTLVGSLPTQGGPTCDQSSQVQESEPLCTAGKQGTDMQNLGAQAQDVEAAAQGVAAAQTAATADNSTPTAVSGDGGDSQAGPSGEVVRDSHGGLASGEGAREPAEVTMPEGTAHKQSAAPPGRTGHPEEVCGAAELREYLEAAWTGERGETYKVWFAGGTTWQCTRSDQQGTKRYTMRWSAEGGGRVHWGDNSYYLDPRELQRRPGEARWYSLGRRARPAFTWRLRTAIGEAAPAHEGGRRGPGQPSAPAPTWVPKSSPACS